MRREKTHSFSFLCLPAPPEQLLGSKTRRGCSLPLLTCRAGRGASSVRLSPASDFPPAQPSLDFTVLWSSV